MSAQWVDQTQGTWGEFRAHEGYRGKTITITVRYKNTGTFAWNNFGNQRVGLYVYKDPTYSLPLYLNDPSNQLYGSSYFSDNSWGNNFFGTQEYTMATLLEESEVFPGEIGSFTFTLHIPTNAPSGWYREDLSLALGPEWLKNPSNGDPLGIAHIWIPIEVL